MSTITTLNTGDSGSSSRTTINTNVSNLNTDKQEKGSGVTGNIVAFGASNVLQDTGKAAPTSPIVGTTDTQVISNKTFVAPILGVATVTSVNKVVIVAPTTAATLAFGVDNATQTFQGTDTIVGRATTDTMTNKRITKRVLALAANSATPAINTDLYDVVHITAQTAAITSLTSGLTGTPVDGDTLRISITGTGSVAITFGASFEASGAVPLSTTTSSTARLDMGFFWNSETSKWRQVAQA
jgi:hypothetical protein